MIEKREGPPIQVAIALYDGVTAVDAVGPYEVLRLLPGTEIRFVARKAGPVIADSGVLVLAATHTYHETPAPDVIVVPGSEADTPTAMADGSLLRWLRTAHETSTWTTSVCTGSLVLAAAGLLDGRPATTHWIAQGRLGAFGAHAQRGRRVVRSGKIVTAAGVSAGVDMALWLASELRGEQQAQVVQLLLEFGPEPPFSTGHPNSAPESIRDGARQELQRRQRNPRNLISIPKILWRKALKSVRGRKVAAD